MHPFLAFAEAKQPAIVAFIRELARCESPSDQPQAVNRFVNLLADPRQGTINLIGPFLAIKYAMPHMIKQKSGSIVCTASVAGLKSGASGHPYAASKAGVISLVQTTAYSLSGTGVRINAVCPGLIETGMTKPVFDRAKERGTQDKIGQLNPLKRPGQPHELAAMGLFLASDEASYVNGQAIPVDGGLTASMPYTGKPV